MLVALWGFLATAVHAAPAAPQRGTVAAKGRFEAELARRKTILRTKRGKDPAAVGALLGLLPELHGEIAVDRLDGLIDGVAADRARHPLVRSYAAYLKARLLEARGRIHDAKEGLISQGYLVGWQIIGPFDNAGRKGESAVYSPETEAFAVDQKMFGKLPDEPLTWRTRDYDSIPRGAYVSLDDLLRPREQVTGYATTWVHVDRSIPVAIHVGTGGPYTAWVDGQLVGQGSAYRSAHPLQESHPATLRKGWNRILIKVSALEGMWGFYARLSTPGGAPIAGLKTSPALPPGKGAHGKRPKAPSTVASLRQALERRESLDRIEFYRYVHPFDRDDKTGVELARRVDTKVRSPRSAWLLGVIDRDPNTSTQALRSGITRARARKDRSMLSRLLLELAWRQRALGLEHRYRELVDEAQKAAPSDPVVQQALIERVSEDGFAWLALARIRKLAKRHPGSDSIHAELASRLRAQGRTREALDVLERLAKRGGGPRSVLTPRLDAMLDLGKADEAADLARRAATTAPGLPEAHAIVARLEEARGNHPDARAALARALALVPQDAQLHAEMGRLMLRGGSRAAAVASFKRSLALRPQQPALRDLLAGLSADSGGDLLARYGVDLAKISRAPVPKNWKGKDAGILHHRVAVQVLPNGLTERLDHRIIRILDDRGIRSQAIQAIAYDPAESTVDVRRARVRRKNGAVVEIGDVQTVALASAGYRMYYDQRQRRVLFAGLRVGDTLEVAFLKRDVAARNMFDEYFGDLMPLQGTEPRKYVEYVLEAPAGKPVYFNVATKKRKIAGGKTIRYRHVAKNVPGIKPEPGMPGWTEIARYLHASTYKTWNDVGNWYWGLVREQLVVDDDIRSAVGDAVRGLGSRADDRAKVHAIYEYVVRNTRYVGLEFGIHGYKPYRTTDVFSRRFGDCKDKASLLKVMLGEVGIDSHLVLVRTRDQGSVPGKPASLAVFNHAITYVPSLDLYLDGTAEWSGPTELPANDQGASVLVVRDGKGAEYRAIPVSKPSDNVRVTKQKIKLKASGAAAVEHSALVSGAAAAGVRFQFQSAEQRRERLAEAFSGLYTGAKVSAVATPGIGNIQRPAEIEATVDVPAWARRDGQRMRFRVLGRDSTLARSLAGQSERTHMLELEVPSTERYELTYDLPRGQRFSQLPSAKTIDTKLGRFELKIEQTPTGARVRSTLQLRKHRIAPKDYAVFRDFLRKVDASLEQTFEVSPAR